MELVGHLVRDWAVEDGEESLQLLRLLPQLLLLVEDGGHQRLDQDPLLLTLLGRDHVKNWLGIETGAQYEDDHNKEGR